MLSGLRCWLFLLGSMSVIGSAAATCSVAASGVAFGSYDPIKGREADITGTINVTCMGTVGDAVHYQVTINQGKGSYHDRQMLSGNHTLHYNVFLDSSRSLVWGDGTAGTGVVSDTLKLTAPSVTRIYVIYGRIMGNQKQLTARTYLDDLIVTVTY